MVSQIDDKGFTSQRILNAGFHKNAPFDTCTQVPGVITFAFKCKREPLAHIVYIEWYKYGNSLS
jgi:hypothetical protein